MVELIKNICKNCFLKQIFNPFSQRYIENLKFASKIVQKKLEYMMKDNSDYKRMKENIEQFNNFIKQEKERFNNMLKMNFYDVVFNFTNS